MLLRPNGSGVPSGGGEDKLTLLTPNVVRRALPADDKLTLATTGAGHKFTPDNFAGGR